MGKEKYQKQIEELFKKSSIVDIGSIQRIIQNKSNSKQYAKFLIRNLILKKKIVKLTKGFYSIYDNPSLLVFCFKHSYLGLQDSLSKNNLWEQETIPIIITSEKVRQGIRKINGSNILIRRIDKKYLWGIEYKKDGNIYLPYSDIEKTFIDMIYFNEQINSDTLNEIKNKINKKKLMIYAKRYPLKIRTKLNNLLNGKVKTSVKN